MQLQDALSVPRRALDVEDYIDIVRRHKGWIIGPAFASLVAAVVGAFLWPNTYISVATIKVQAQQVPETFVQSNMGQQMSEKITGITQQVLSRSNLTTIIQTQDLYQKDRARLPMEDVIEKMKKDVMISPVQAFGSTNQNRVPAFQVSFAYTDRFKAQKVVADITTKFIDESIRSQSSNNNGTIALLKDQLDQARKEMEDVETRWANFRTEHMGSLPEEQQTNVMQVNAMQTRIMNLNSQLARASQEKLGLESQLRISKDQLTAMREPVKLSETEIPLQKSEKVLTAEREVAELERAVSILRERYKDNYPQVQTTLGMLQSAKKKLADAQKEDAARKPEVMRAAGNPNAAREMRELDAQVKRFQTAIEANALEQETYKREMDATNRQMMGLQSRLVGTPFSEKAYQELSRERDTAKSKYIDLEAKMQKASLSDEMNKRKFGESLELLDAASLPQTPARPQREMIIAMGAVIGVVIGFLLAGAREMKDTSLKNLKDVRAYTQLPILGSIPLLENDLVVKRRKRIAWLGWSLAGLGGVVLMTGSVVYYFVTKV